MKRREVLTTCPLCGVGCNFYLQLEKEKIIGVAPSLNHSISKGRLCRKGWNIPQYLYHLNRLKTPLIKKGDSFKEVSWSEAEEFVAKNINKIKKSFSPEKIGVISSKNCTNEESFLIQKFARAVLGTNNIDHSRFNSHSASALGLRQSFGSAAATNSIDELLNSKCIFIIGSDPLETHPIIGWRIVSAKDRGAKIILVNSRRSSLAKLSDIHLDALPKTETVLINALMNVILANELEDKQFIHDRTEYLKELKRIVNGYSPFYAQKITSVSKQDIIKAAKMFVEHKPAAIVYGSEIADEKTELSNAINLANLAMLTGNVGVESSGIHILRGQSNIQGACDLGVLPNFFPGYQDVEDEHIRQRFQHYWKVKLPVKKGLSASEMFQRAGKIKLFYIIGEDVVGSGYNAEDIARCFKRAELVVVQDSFMSETAKLADVILPTSIFTEKEGSFTNTDRRLQLVRKAIEPFCDAKSDSDIIIEISKKLGFKGMAYENCASVMDEIAELTPIYGGVSHARLEKQSLQWPCWSKPHLGTQFLHKGRFARGRGRFFGIEYKPPKEWITKAYPFVLISQGISGSVCINRTDAKELKIKDGLDVEIAMRNSSLTAKVCISDDIRRGVIWMSADNNQGGSKLCTANINLRK